METTIREIAAMLRSTDEMAAQFVQRVQVRVADPVSEAEILTVMQKIPVKSLSMDKVVARVQQQKKSPSRRTARTATHPSPSAAAPEEATDFAANADVGGSSPTVPRRETKTILEQLESVLAENWDRATADGLAPERLSAEAFVNAIYQYTDRREGTRQRILQAARQLDKKDVILTPALVADIVHQLFEG
jgi:hypothetical protein